MRGGFVIGEVFNFQEDEDTLQALEGDDFGGGRFGRAGLGLRDEILP